MPRTKEFEPDAALERAMEIFWHRGYEATSVQDLLDVMEIGRGSLYSTFGDKHALFLAALDRYESARTLWMIEELDGSDSPKDTIKYVLERTVERLSSDEHRRGCLLANSAIELAPHDPDVARKITHYLRRTEHAFHRALIRDNAFGETGPRQDPRAVARFLVNSLQGLRVLAKSGVDRTMLEDAARVTTSILE